jgi:para-nitrobenzyl esterase
MQLRRKMTTAIQLALFATVSWCDASMADPIIRTSNGNLRGIAQQSTDVFYGIPYAMPPLGDLRWKAPQAVPRWQGVRAATAPSAACYQPAPREFGPYSAEFLIQGIVSEDCLYLNVWKPAKVSAKLPVFFFIHGGGFSSGSATVPIYNGSSLAARGAVVVTINYRLGVFGFLAHPELTRDGHGSSGNYGVLDMIAALRWVRTNIARFGGDPDNVTIAGQSAGAAAVNDLVLSPPAKGLFHRAIAQSGSGMGIAMPTLGEAEKSGLEMTQRAGPQSIAQLRRLPAAELQKLTEAPPPAPGEKFRMPSIGFWPNVDGLVILGNPEQKTVKAVSNVPFLTGFNADEGLIFGAPKSSSEFETYVRDRYDLFADRLLALYPHADAAQVADSIQLLARDRYMASLLFWARNRTIASRGKVFAYFFDHPYPATKGVGFGAFHTAEVPYVMGALGKGDRIFTRQDEEFSSEMQNQWLAFMKTGNPSVRNHAWPPVDAQDLQVMKIGPSAGLHPAVSSKERLSLFWDYVQAGGKLSLF